LIGRDEDAARLRELTVKADGRLVTLTGVGGIGKTALARHVARGLVDLFRDGVWWIELAPLSDARLVPQAVAAALSVHEQADQPLLRTLCTFVSNRQMSIVLDNCEHIIAACGDLAEALLAAGLRLRLLVTSREPLRIDGEVVWRMASLTTPDPKRSETASELMRCAAVQLFVERARAVQSTFAVSAGTRTRSPP
jgi:predicted ATPase